MFTCDACAKSIGPRVSPIIIPVATREVSYTNKRINEEGKEEIVVSKGTEIVSEEKWCRACAGLPEIPPSPSVDRTYYKNLSRTAAEHTKGCKKVLEDCRVCKRIVETFQSLSLPALNVAIGD